jgi:hypothetical protein
VLELYEANSDRHVEYFSSLSKEVGGDSYTFNMRLNCDLFASTNLRAPLHRSCNWLPTSSDVMPILPATSDKHASRERSCIHGDICFFSSRLLVVGGGAANRLGVHLELLFGLDLTRFDGRTATAEPNVSTTRRGLCILC